VVGVLGLKLGILLVTFGLTISRLGSVLLNLNADLRDLVQSALKVAVVVLNDLLMHVHLTVVVVVVGLEIVQQTLA
jgi:hypothetical protein